MIFLRRIQPQSKKRLRCIASKANKTGSKTWFWSKNQTGIWTKNSTDICNIGLKIAGGCGYCSKNNPFRSLAIQTRA